MNVAQEGPETLLIHRENEFGLGMAAGPWPGCGPYSGAKDSSPRQASGSETPPQRVSGCSQHGGRGQLCVGVECACLGS